MDSEDREANRGRDAKMREPLGFIEFFVLGIACVLILLCVVAAVRLF